MPASIYAISALCGCFRWESSMNPNIWESDDPQTWDTMWHRNEHGDGVGGYGLGQWTNTGAGEAMRLQRMYNWCVANGKDITNGNSQLNYMCVETYNGVDGGLWYNSYHQGSNAQTLAEFLQTDSTNLDGLVADFLANWEGVPNDHLSERQAYARQNLQYIRDHINDDPSTLQWQTTGTWIIPEAMQLNNVLCTYFYMQGYDPGPGPGPGPGPTPTGRRKMPIWMYLKRLPF